MSDLFSEINDENAKLRDGFDMIESNDRPRERKVDEYSLRHTLSELIAYSRSSSVGDNYRRRRF